MQSHDHEPETMRIGTGGIVCSLLVFIVTVILVAREAPSLMGAVICVLAVIPASALGVGAWLLSNVLWQTTTTAFARWTRPETGVAPTAARPPSKSAGGAVSRVG